MGVRTDPIRPGNPGRREGGEASRMPQIGQGKPRAWGTFWGPCANIARSAPWQRTQSTAPPTALRISAPAGS